MIHIGKMYIICEYLLKIFFLQSYIHIVSLKNNLNPQFFIHTNLLNLKKNIVLLTA